MELALCVSAENTRFIYKAVVMCPVRFRVRDAYFQPYFGCGVFETLFCIEKNVSRNGEKGRSYVL